MNDTSICSETQDDGAKTGDFSLDVSKVAGNCKVGEEWAKTASREGKIPVLSCEGPCAKGEIARRAATLIPKLDGRFERACHGEAFYVPHSSMAKWVTGADRVVMIDGCFLNCHGRVLENLVGDDRIVHINAHVVHKKYGDTFSRDDAPDEELSDLAKQVADETIAVVYQAL